MTKDGTNRSTAIGSGRRSAWWTKLARWTAAGAMVLAFIPTPAHAQFGRLKKLKDKFSAPDSTARAKDSLAQIAAGVKPESVKVGKSFLQKSASVVSSANGMLESTTGISAKDAALAASGIGAGNLVAKKLGLDPMSIGAQAIANAKMSAQQRAMQKVASGGAPAAHGGGMDGAQLQAMQRAAIGTGAGAGRANSAAMANAAAMGGYTQADADALIAFQQEMMLVSQAASAGDGKAQARLQAWEAIALKYQPEMQRLSIAASAGDVASVEKMQRMQFDLIREWMNTGGTHAKLPKGKKQ